MNYLFHLYLSPPTEEAWVGNLMGDFVKGKLGTLYPEAITQGIALHRSVDSFAAQNSSFLRCKRHINPSFRHYRGVLVDMYLDHLLARDWERYHQKPLEIFAASAYRALEKYFEILPANMQPVAERMIKMNWLTSYREESVLELALRNMGKRLKRPFPLEEGMVDFKRNQREIEKDFSVFAEEVKLFTDNCTY